MLNRLQENKQLWSSFHYRKGNHITSHIVLNGFNFDILVSNCLVRHNLVRHKASMILRIWLHIEHLSTRKSIKKGWLVPKSNTFLILYTEHHSFSPKLFGKQPSIALMVENVWVLELGNVTHILFFIILLNLYILTWN
jgi:hypothetical protein